MKIFINPGHDRARDPGAGNARLGLNEADVVARIGEAAGDYLADAGYHVRRAQHDDLTWLCDAANHWRADAFVSIHCNASDGSARGTETWYCSSAGEWLARCIQRQIVGALGTVDRGVKAGDFYVLRATDMPAVLVETAFIDNSDDARLLLDRQDDFAAAIARGISDFFQ